MIFFSGQKDNDYKALSTYTDSVCVNKEFGAISVKTFHIDLAASRIFHITQRLWPAPE